MMKKYMTRYFTLLLSILMGVVMIGIDTAMASHDPNGDVGPVHGWEEPNSDAVWFTTLPPAIHTDVADAITNGTLKATTTGLRRNKSYYFNLYVVDDGASAKFYFADPTKPDNDPPYLSECTVNTNCASAMIEIYSRDFALCIISSLLHSAPGSNNAYLSETFWRPRIMGCSDADTCEGKVRGGRADDGRLIKLGQFAGNVNGYCWNGGVTKEAIPALSLGESVPLLAVDAPIYFRFINTDPDGVDFTDIVSDFTVGVKVTGTSR